MNEYVNEFKSDIGYMSGFRLYKLEVYNWGSFDGVVWSFHPRAETSLLTGEVGSGKSTLVDAITTMLIHPRKIDYNKAADTTAKERTLSTYIRGHIGLNKNPDGTEQPNNLRDANSFSVLLATFLDGVHSHYITLAQLFWYHDAQKSPRRIYVIADREMWIANDFSRFGKDIRALKKRLKQSEKTAVFDDFNRYATVFRDKLGIGNEQAMDLFQQTISMKKVDSLTDFVRSNMLELPNTGDDVRILIEHFHDLNSAHEAVLKAKRQISLLKPLAEIGSKCDEYDRERAFLNMASDGLIPWFADLNIKLIESRIVKLEADFAYAGAKLKKAESELAETEKAIKDTEREINENGGYALETLKRDIQALNKELDIIRRNRKNYEEDASAIGLPVPSSLDIFVDNKRCLPNLYAKEDDAKNILEKSKNAVGVIKVKLENDFKNVNDELESLRSRNTSINRENVELRKRLCGILRIHEEELPYVGELIEVCAEDSRWEGAIERLLRNFGLSLLVPDKHYQEVAEWVDNTPLGMRLIYYRIRTDSEYIFDRTDQSSRSGNAKKTLHAASVSEKINIKPGSPFGIWLTKELNFRFPHICCETIGQFRQEMQAITKAGHIKGKGNYHEKDDRRAVGDRKYYILGFSNRKKITALENDEKSLKEEIHSIQIKIDSYNKTQNETLGRLASIIALERIDEYSDIDVEAKEKSIREKEDRKKRLEQENDVLKGLQRQLDALEKKREAQKGIVKEAEKSITLLESEINRRRSDLVVSNDAAKDANEAMRVQIFPFLTERKPILLGNISLSLDL